MIPTRGAADYIATFCYGNLYERLVAIPEMKEDAQRAAAEWNDMVVILQTLSSLTASASVAEPAIDLETMQRRVLAEYTGHPLLQPSQPLLGLLRQNGLGAPGLGELITVNSSCTDTIVAQAEYVDRVRRDLGQLM